MTRANFFLIMLSSWRATLRNRTVDLLLTIGIRSQRQPGISPEGQVRRSTSARLGEVRDSSRRMRPPRFLPTAGGGGAHARSRFHPARSVFDTRCRRAGRACRGSPRRAQRRRPPTGRRLPARTPGERHRPRHPPVHRGGRARRGGHRGVCLLLARLRGRPGPRRDRDHRPARASHDRRPRLRQFDGGAVRRPAPGASTLPRPLAARAGNRRYPHGEHGTGLVPRSGRGGGRGLAGGQSRGLVRTSGLAHPHLRGGRPRAVGSAPLHWCGPPCCAASCPGLSR